MKRDIYLSIDLDYWRYDESPDHCREFFKQVFALRLPLYTVMTHHHLLLDVEAAGVLENCREVWNVDWHSDLCEEAAGTTLNEGTWGALISWRHLGTFVWRYPRAACIKNQRGITGYCHVGDNPFTDRNATAWKKTILRKGTKGIPWRRIQRIGLCLSPNWVGPLDIVDYPLRKLKLVGLMKQGVALCNKDQDWPAIHDTRCYMPGVFYAS